MEKMLPKFGNNSSIAPFTAVGVVEAFGESAFFEEFCFKCFELLIEQVVGL